MKTNIKILLTFIVLTASLASCMKETFPQSGTATKEQIGESASALDAAMSGIPAQLSQGYLVYGEQNDETDMAYPGLMIAFTEQLGDIFCQGSNTGYDWYSTWNTGQSLGYNLVRTYIPWRTLYMFVKSANDIISAVSSVEEPTSIQQGYQGMGYLYRAWAYWHLWNMYVPVENKYTDCSKVMGLTVPIVTDLTAEADGKNNPRATVEEMFSFIMSDLDLAEEALTSYTPASKLYPNLAVVYGMKARAYLSHLDYAKAAEYARKAINASGCTPLTAAQWLDPKSGFCDASSQNSWMWYISYSAETMGNLCNFTGWIAGEADWGYNSLCFFGINRWLYDRLSYTDFRKQSFLDPDRAKFNYQTSRDDSWLASLPNYTSLKFRCKGGDWENYATGGACDVPIMRVEEMYLIEAEATGVSNLSEGQRLLEAFVQTRDPQYSIPTAATNLEGFQEEVLFHKRIEFWGEGTALFDAKRLKVGSYQAYEGTNAPGNTFMLNAEGIKPAWVYPIPQSEVNNNTALEGLNNPDPTKAIGPTNI